MKGKDYVFLALGAGALYVAWSYLQNKKSIDEGTKAGEAVASTYFNIVNEGRDAGEAVADTYRSLIDSQNKQTNDLIGGLFDYFNNLITSTGQPPTSNYETQPSGILDGMSDEAANTFNNIASTLFGKPSLTPSPLPSNLSATPFNSVMDILSNAKPNLSNTPLYAYAVNNSQSKAQFDAIIKSGDIMANQNKLTPTTPIQTINGVLTNTLDNFGVIKKGASTYENERAPAVTSSLPSTKSLIASGAYSSIAGQKSNVVRRTDYVRAKDR